LRLICEDEFLLVKLSEERAGCGFVFTFDFDVMQVNFTKLQKPKACSVR